MQPVAAVRRRRRLEFLKTQMARLRPGPTSSGLALIATDTVCRPMRAVDAAAAKVPRLRLAIVKRNEDVKGFVVLPRRWVVERTFSWFGHNRRLAKDFENLGETLATFVTLASIQLALRRLARA